MGKTDMRMRPNNRSRREATDKIGINHLRVLVALQQLPLGTYDELSERVGLSKSVVYNYVKQLSSWPGTGTQYFVVAAVPHLENLGLELLDVLVAADNENKIQRLESICHRHPYTVYRARCFGDTNGMLIQFRTPRGTSAKIERLFDRAIKNDVCDNYRILPFSGGRVTYTTMNLDNWNVESLRWTFDWAKWFSIRPDTVPHEQQEKSHHSDIRWLTRTDLFIIRELTRDARQKNNDIIKRLEESGIRVSSQTFSRRLQLVMERCISGYRVQINPYAFDAYNPVLIWGRGEREDVMALDSRIRQHPVPFTSTFKSFQDWVFWYLHLPSTHLSDLLFHLRPVLKDLRFNYVDHTRSKTYYLWPDTFDESVHDWRRDDRFMIDDVLD